MEEGYAELCNQDLREIILSGSNLSCANLKNVNLEKAIIKTATLFKINLQDGNLIAADLSGSNLSSAYLENANLSDAILRGTNFKGAKLQNTNLSGADLSGSDLSSAYLENANLSGAILRGTNLKGAKLQNTNLSGADLTDACLDHTLLKDIIIDNNTKINPKYYLIWEITNKEVENRNLSGQDLRRANLSGLNLTKAILKDTNLAQANLENTKLQRAILTGAILTEANLTRAKLTGANLRGAELTKSTIINANFAKANFGNTDLSQTNTKLTNVSTLNGAYYNDETKFPEGFDPKIKKMIWSNYQDPQWIKDLLNNKVEPQKYPPSREGQEKFKEELTKKYGHRCLISGCEIKEIIEAAHIIPYSKIESHDVANGLLLRVDLHRLFDAHLIAIHPTTREVLISEQIAKDYQDIRGIEIVSCLTGEDATKQQDALRYHGEQCNWIDKQLLE
nr:pentapeptide repeat-containing protein [Sphaerospermopsis torques-reginae]